MDPYGNWRVPGTPLTWLPRAPPLGPGMSLEWERLTSPLLIDSCTESGREKEILEAGSIACYCNWEASSSSCSVVLKRLAQLTLLSTSASAALGKSMFESRIIHAEFQEDVPLSPVLLPWLQGTSSPPTGESPPVRDY